jgi:glycosyltransferase involved in cell wall biosynthesis
MNPIISIIVPIYKVERYLRRCLDSILAQTFIDFECILVDDGSPDNCLVICDEYAKKDNRIAVIHKENAGVAAARDSGLSKAFAEFVMYVDSDDWIEPNALELLYRKQRETDADIVVGSMKRIHLWGNIFYICPKIPKNMQPIAYFLFYCHKGLVSKLFRKNLFLNYIVPETNVGEDTLVNVQIFSIIKPEKLQQIDDVIYNYDNTTSGTTNNLSKIYKSYTDSPDIKIRLWVEQHFNDSRYDNSIRIACLYFVYESLINYLILNYKNVPKNDIEIFYKNYHKEFARSKYRKIIKTRLRLIIPIFHLSFPFGKAYIKVLIFMRYVRRFMKLQIYPKG